MSADVPVAAPDHARIRLALNMIIVSDRMQQVWPEAEAALADLDALLAERQQWNESLESVVELNAALIEGRQQDKERIERLETALENADEELGRAPAMAVPHLVESFKRQLLLAQRIIRAALAVEEDATPGKPETPGNSGAAVEEDTENG